MLRIYSHDTGYSLGNYCLLFVINCVVFVKLDPVRMRLRSDTDPEVTPVTPKEQTDRNRISRERANPLNTPAEAGNCETPPQYQQQH